MTDAARMPHPVDLPQNFDPHGPVTAPAEPPTAEFELDEFASVVAVSAHPDDETLGAGGLIAHARGAGIPVTIVVASFGEHSHPRSPTHSPTDLATIRRAEMLAAAAELGVPAARVYWCEIGDGDVQSHIFALRDTIAKHVTPGACVISPLDTDGHPDHHAVAIAAALAVFEHAATTENKPAQHWCYPLWWRLWATRSLAVATGRDVRALHLSPAAHATKRRACACHASQCAPLSDRAGDEALLGAQILAACSTDIEYFARGPAPGPVQLEQMYAGSADPWGFNDSEYERRKRDLTCALLTRPLGHVLDIGCATGQLTITLAVHAASVTALDSALGAVARAAANAKAARAICPSAQVRAFVMNTETHVPAVSAPCFDTVVLSEVGYFLRRGAWERLCAHLASVVNPRGQIVTCHWKHPVTGLDLDGPAADAAAATIFTEAGWRCHSTINDDDFTARVYVRKATPTLAAGEGRTP